MGEDPRNLARQRVKIKRELRLRGIVFDNNDTLSNLMKKIRGE